MVAIVFFATLTKGVIWVKAYLFLFLFIVFFACFDLFFALLFSLSIIKGISTGDLGDCRRWGRRVNGVSCYVCFIFCLFKLYEFARIII